MEITYKLITDSDCIKMTCDGIVSFIPADPGNRDYIQYQAWLAEGNTPEPADEE